MAVREGAIRSSMIVVVILACAAILIAIIFRTPREQPALGRVSVPSATTPEKIEPAVATVTPTSDSTPNQTSDRRIHGRVDDVNGTIDAFGISVASFGTLLMDFGSAGIRPELRVKCVGRQFLLKGTFIEGLCDSLSIDQHKIFHYIPGEQILIGIQPEEDAKDSPDFVDVFKTNLPVMIDQYGNDSEGQSIDSPSSLGAGWSGFSYSYEDGSAGLYSLVDRLTGDRVTLRCVGLVVPRAGRSEIKIPNFCPDLKAVLTSEGFKVFMMWLTTNDHHLYFSGIENDRDKARRAYFTYARE